MKPRVPYSLFFAAMAAWCLARADAFAYPTVYPTGTTIHEADKTWDGYTLYRPGVKNIVLLVGMDGRPVHSWKPAGYTLYTVRPLPDGHILGIAEPYDEGEPRPIRQRIVELDWSGREVWSFADVARPDSWAHHDTWRLENGNTLLLYFRVVSVPEISSLPVRDDYLVEVDALGRIVWEWHTCDHFDELGFSPKQKPLIARDGGDWSHTNAIQPLPGNTHADPCFRTGNILVSQRNTSTMFIIDRQTGGIVWKIGPEDCLTIGQHQAHMIEPGLPGAGNILALDNGGAAGYPTKTRGYSRVVEINPVTREIVFEYNAGHEGREMFTFFTPILGGVQRLPNGNTLVCEGVPGRFFEISPERQTVWEYVNPWTATGGTRCYRAYRLDASWPPQP